MGKDDKIGQTTINLSEDIIKNQDKPQWKSLDNNHGDICYLITLDLEEQSSIETSVKKPSEIIKEFEQIAEKSTSQKIKDESLSKIVEVSPNDNVDNSASEELLDDGLPSLETVNLNKEEIEKKSTVPSISLTTSKPVDKIGKARITIHRGKKLEKRGLFGKPDPYVMLIQKENKFKSKSLKSTTNPEWNFT